MDEKQIENKLKALIITKGGLSISESELTLDTKLNDKNITIDSIQALEILVGIENEFGIYIEDDDVSPVLLSSVRNLYEYIINSVEK